MENIALLLHHICSKSESLDSYTPSMYRAKHVSHLMLGKKSAKDLLLQFIV